MKWFKLALGKYATFTGRAQRAEFWYFILFFWLITIGLITIDNLVGSANYEFGTGLLSGIFWLATFIPGIAVSVRRLHDTNRSGWWLLLDLIPFIGGIILFVWFVRDGTPGDNRFGANPKAGTR